MPMQIYWNTDNLKKRESVENSLPDEGIRYLTKYEAFFLNEKKKSRFIYVGVNVNARSSKAILVESTESN